MLFRLLFAVMPCVVWAVAWFTLVRPMRLGRGKSAALGALLMVCLAKFAVFGTLGGELFNPRLQAVVIYAFGAAYGFAEIWAGLAFAVWLAGLPRRVVRRVGPSPRAARVSAALCAALSLAAVAEGLWQTLRIPPVREIDLPYEGLPPDLDGYRIVHMSDLHASVATFRTRFERIVERVNALDADLIAVTGDFADGYPDEMAPLLAPLSGLKARDGVYGCTGNHEFYWDWPGTWRMLHGYGLRFPDAAAVAIRRGSAVIRVGAMDDEAAARFDETYFPSPFRHFAPESAEGEFRIMLCHRPTRSCELAAWAKVDLQLSGHTHAGMALPLRPIVALFNEGRVRGTYGTGRGWLHVSPGTGQWAGFPLRILNPAEITVIRLSSRPKTKLSKK